MEHSNEFLARVYGAYIGCEYFISDKHGTFTQKITPEVLHGIYSGGIRKGKLLLTPLSAITDEDAIEAQRLHFIGEGDPIVKDWKKIVYCAGELQFYRQDGVGYYSLPINQPVIDFLRHKGYDCGYAHIISLIEAGIAISK